MNATTVVRMPRLSTLLRLGRISNIPTVWTNVLAGSVMSGQSQWLYVGIVVFIVGLGLLWWANRRKS